MVSKILFVVAILIGLFGAYGVKSYVDRETRGVQVLAAKVDVSAGETLKAEHVKVIDVPSRFASFGNYAVKKADSALAIGRPVTTDIHAEEAILYSHFDPIKSQRDLFARMGAEDRAVSLVVNDATSVANAVEPGDYVDVIGTFKPQEGLKLPAALAKAPAISASTPEGQTVQNIIKDLEANSGGSEAAKAGGSSAAAAGPEKGIYTRTILQRMQVLGVGKRFSDARYSLGNPLTSRYNVVTLKATPIEAEVLVFAQALGGNLTLALRHPGSKEKKPIERVNFDNFGTIVDGTAR
jgi:Flp pilus assembly protein CpaB